MAWHRPLSFTLTHVWTQSDRHSDTRAYTWPAGNGMADKTARESGQFLVVTRWLGWAGRGAQIVSIIRPSGHCVCLSVIVYVGRVGWPLVLLWGATEPRASLTECPSAVGTRCALHASLIHPRTRPASCTSGSLPGYAALRVSQVIERVGPKCIHRSKPHWVDVLISV